MNNGHDAICNMELLYSQSLFHFGLYYLYIYTMCSYFMCDKNTPINIKYKIYKTIGKPAMKHMSECWAVEDKVTQTLHITEMRMLRWTRGMKTST